MLNSDGNENPKKANFACAAHFLYIVLNDQNMKLPSYTFHGENVVFPHKKFCCLCSCSFFFFTASHFSSCWPLAFLIFSLLQLLNFHVILPANFFFFNSFFISPTSSFCDIHVSVDIKMQWKKRVAFVFFFSLKVQVARRVVNVTLEIILHVGGG